MEKELHKRLEEAARNGKLVVIDEDLLADFEKALTLI